MQLSHFSRQKLLPKSISYSALEAYPVSKKELEELNYLESSRPTILNKVYKLMHDSPWEEFISLSNNFTLKKLRMDFRELAEVNQYDIVYYDAFGPRVQPELWTREIFAKVFLAMKENGILVTYSCKGSVRRALLECGFKVEKLPGPPGKREMLRAYKPIKVLSVKSKLKLVWQSSKTNIFEKKLMKVLITGATGLVGRALTELFIKEGYSVNYLTTSSEKIKQH